MAQGSTYPGSPGQLDTAWTLGRKLLGAAAASSLKLGQVIVETKAAPEADTPAWEHPVLPPPLGRERLCLPLAGEPLAGCRAGVWLLKNMAWLGQEVGGWGAPAGYWRVSLALAVALISGRGALALSRHSVPPSVSANQQWNPYIGFS